MARTTRRAPSRQTVSELFANVRRNYFRLYFHYMYFNVARIFYLQADNIFPYVILAPTIVAAKITFGTHESDTQRLRAQVRDSFQFLVNSWTTIVELMSIYKRLRGLDAVDRGRTIARHRPALSRRTSQRRAEQRSRHDSRPLPYLDPPRRPAFALPVPPPGKRLISLAINESAYGASPAAVAAATARLSAPHRYPDPSSSDLRRAIGDAFDLDPERIICGNGSEELLDVIGRLFARPGDRIIMSQSGFFQFALVASPPRRRTRPRARTRPRDRCRRAAGARHA